MRNRAAFEPIMLKNAINTKIKVLGGFFAKGVDKIFDLLSIKYNGIYFSLRVGGGSIREI